jgi:cyclase
MERGRLVKTIRFGERKYVGDPINTVKILNDKEVDELVLLDISATPDSTPPNIDLITEIASECFMPLAYGGGITDLSQARSILNAGVEKLIVNSSFYANPAWISEVANIFGSQSVVVSIDAGKRKWRGGYQVRTRGGKLKVKSDPVTAAIQAVEAGAGEILINSIDGDGMQQGYDIGLTKSVADAVDVPVICCGGASSTTDFVLAVQKGHASAVAAGSMFVFKGPHRAVLVSYPGQDVLFNEVFNKL